MLIAVWVPSHYQIGVIPTRTMLHYVMLPVFAYSFSLIPHPFTLVFHSLVHATSLGYTVH
jgi:hypothetical protein